MPDSHFLDWADKVFRLTKKSLTRSKTFDAYVGEGDKNGRIAVSVNKPN